MTRSVSTSEASNTLNELEGMAEELGPPDRSYSPMNYLNRIPKRIMTPVAGIVVGISILSGTIGGAKYIHDQYNPAAVKVALLEKRGEIPSDELIIRSKAGLETIYFVCSAFGLMLGLLGGIGAGCLTSDLMGPSRS